MPLHNTNLDSIGVVLARNTLHQVGRGMIAEIGWDVSDAQSTIWSQLFGVRIIFAVQQNLKNRKMKLATFLSGFNATSPIKLRQKGAFSMKKGAFNKKKGSVSDSLFSSSFLKFNLKECVMRIQFIATHDGRERPWLGVSTNGKYLATNW